MTETSPDSGPEAPLDAPTSGPDEAASSVADESGASDPRSESEPEPDDRVDVDLPPREPTGDQVVDAALDQVDAARGSGLEDHLKAAASAQDALQQRLADTGE